MVCFDNASKPFEICIDDAVTLAATNDSNVLQTLDLDTLATKLNATVSARVSNDLYYSINILPKDVPANCGKGSDVCGNIIVSSKNKTLLKEMLLTLKFTN